MMEIIKDLNKIRELQTREFPKSDDVWVAVPGFTKGFVTAVYSPVIDRFVYGHHNDLDSVANYFDTLKAMDEKFPEQLGLDLNEMYIYGANGKNGINHHTRWALLGKVIK